MGSIRVGWWYMQNLFDTDDDLIDGQGPELLGVCEVEGDAVFQELLDEIGEAHLKIVGDPAGTSDLRGIDTSLAYDDRKLRPVEQRSHVVHLRYAHARHLRGRL